MNDTAAMQRAIELAGKGAGLASPGPMVGAVIVKDGVIVGEGFYTWEGIEHAEALALAAAGARSRGAAVFISLEPCNHVKRAGRTQSCAQALIDAGVSRVVAAMRDPNPAVNGGGLQMLRDAGIGVEVGLLEAEARRLNEAFIVQVTEQRPFGILKVAMTLDGKIATAAGESQWITSEESRRQSHAIRHACDAIVTGSGTFLKDRPQMTDRTGLPRRRDLLRVVLDRRSRVASAPDWLVFRGPLDALTHDLAAREVQSFVLECGPDLAFNAIQAGIIDKMVVFIAPRLLGGRDVAAFGGAGIGRLADAIALDSWTVSPSGPDMVITAYVHRNH